MKYTLKSIASILLGLVLMVTYATTAFAATASITYQGQNAGINFQPGSDYTATDLFDNFKDVMPGDKLTENIQVTNEATDCDYINLYMRAIAHEEAGNPLTYSESFEQADGIDGSQPGGGFQPTQNLLLHRTVGDAV